MSDNKYELNLHFNSASLNDTKGTPEDLYNENIDYHISPPQFPTNLPPGTLPKMQFPQSFLLALYDGSYYSYYHAGESSNRGAYYGTITTNYYDLHNGKLRYLQVFPKKGRANNGGEAADFKVGEVDIPSTGLPTYPKNGKIVLSRYDNSLNKNVDVLVMEQRDIIDQNGQPLNINSTYKLAINPRANKMVVIDNLGYEVGHLKDSTIFIDENPQKTFHICSGNPFDPGNINNKCSEISRDGKDKITLSRESGGITYEFVDGLDKKTSYSDTFCTDIGGCKMKDLNLVPNIRTYLKSTLVSSDIADIQGTQNVDQVAVAANVKYILAKDGNFQQAVKGQIGPPGLAGQDGMAGRDADPADVAQALVTNPTRCVG